VQHKLGWLQTKHFQSLYRVFETLAGYREVQKYLLIYAIDLLRERLFIHGETLVKAGPLNDVSQIFKLTLENLKEANSDNSLDLKLLGASNRQFADRLCSVSVLPSIFDSRGRISDQNLFLPSRASLRAHRSRPELLKDGSKFCIRQTRSLCCAVRFCCQGN
jgi:hypothetical protein